MKSIFLVLSLLVAESFAADWTSVWLNYEKLPPVNVTNVSVNLYVRQFGGVNVNDMTYDVQLTYREKWQEPKLAYDPPNADSPNSTYETVDRHLLWTPDTFFSNEVSGHGFELMSENSLARVFPNGEVLLSRRIQLKLSCPMDLRRFPFDTQQCSIMLASYGHTTEQIIYTWTKTAPLQITENINLREFTLTNFRTDYCTSKTSTGQYSCLTAHLTLSRSWCPYIFKVFLPALMLVTLAYMTVWIKDVTARAVLLSVVLALALVGYCSLSFVLPATAYFKAIDSFLVISLIFIFGIVVKFSIEWSRQRTFEKNDSVRIRDVVATSWYPIAYVLVVVIALAKDLS